MPLDQNKGIFICAEPNSATKDRLIEWALSQGIHEHLPKDELHCTIIWSRVYVPYELQGELDQPIEIDPRTYSIQRLGPDAIVLRFENDTLQEHHWYARRLGAKYDFPEYIPHLSITYNGGSYSDEFLNNIQLPKFPLVFDRFKSNELDPTRLST